MRRDDVSRDRARVRVRVAHDDARVRRVHLVEPMSLHEFQVARQLRHDDVPFYALIMAAMWKADTSNIEKLRAVFPETWHELDARYHGAGGRIRGDADFEEIQRERESLGLPPT